MKLYEKLLELRKEIDIMQKDTKGYNYTYVSEDSILLKIKDKMTDLKLLLKPIIVPNTITNRDLEYNDKKGFPQKDVIVQAEMIFRWYDIDTGDFDDTSWALIGQQSDSSQSFGSALTYAGRYFLLKYFNVATTNDDPDKIAKDQAEKEKNETIKVINSYKKKIIKLFEELNTKYASQDKAYESIGLSKAEFIAEYESNDELKLKILSEQMEGIVND